MSNTRRHFQMLGSLVAQRDEHTARLPVHSRVSQLLGPKDSHRVMAAYTGALNGRYGNPQTKAYAEQALSQERAKVLRGTRPKLESVKTVRPYAVGEHYRPKRANQHSRDIVVVKVLNSHISYRKQEQPAIYDVSHEEFAALIGRKV